MPAQRIRAGQIAVDMLCEKRCPATAVMAYNDFTAAGVIAAAAKKGFKVPEDLSVTGLDGAEISRCTLPVLTTAAQPFELQGSTAGELLMKMLNKETVSGNAKLIPRLQTGGSTARAGRSPFTGE